MKIYSNVNIPLVAFVFSSFIAMATAISNSTDTSTAILLRVDQLGKGDFKKIQDAIDAVPSNNKELVFIWVKPGTYRFVHTCPAK